MKKLNNTKKTRRIASALAALSILSAMAMPVTTISASAAEETVITETENNDFTLDETKEETIISEITDSAAVNAGERGPVKPIQNDKLQKAIESAMKKLVSMGLGKIPVCGGALSGIFDGICGLFEEEPPVPATIEQIDELLQKYNAELKEAISESHDDIIKEISSVSEINNFYSPFVEFVGQVNYLEGEINAIKDYDMTENRKIFKTGELIGKKDTWGDTNTIIGHMNTLKEQMNKTGLLSNQGIFEALYKHYEKESMFSGEAKAKAQEAVDYIYAEMLYGYTLVMECLSSQLQIVQLEDKSEFDAYELNTICRDANDIITRMVAVTGMTFGDPQLVDETSTTVWFTDIEPEARPGRTIEKILYSEHNLIPPGIPEGAGYGYYGIDGYSGMGTQVEYYHGSSCYGYKVTDTIVNTVECLPKDSLTGMYDNFNKIYDQTYINKGNASVKLSKNFKTNGFSTYGSDELKRIVNIQPIGEADIKNIVKYAGEKGMTAKQFLKSVGFNTDCINSDSFLTTGDVWNDHNVTDDLVQSLTQFIGSDRLDVHYFIRVIDPNTKGAGTQDKKYRSMGYTIINIFVKKWVDRWDYVESDMRNKTLVLFQNA